MDSMKGLQKNVDVVFREVAYIEATLWSFEFLFDEASLSERLRAEKQLGRRLHSHLTAYVLRSGDRRFLIIAGDVTVKENDLELSESSLKHWGDAG